MLKSLRNIYIPTYSTGSTTTPESRWRCIIAFLCGDGTRPPVALLYHRPLNPRGPDAFYCFMVKHGCQLPWIDSFQASHLLSKPSLLSKCPTFSNNIFTFARSPPNFSLRTTDFEIDILYETPCRWENHCFHIFFDIFCDAFICWNRSNNTNEGESVRENRRHTVKHA